MDDTELHYINYDAEETWADMLKTYIEAGGDVLYPGDEKEMLLRGALSFATAIMAKVDSALRMATLRYAVGDYLKLYGESRDCAYREAEAATAPIKITFQASGIARTIPKGAKLTADGAVLYSLQADISQTGNAQEATASIVCDDPGAAGNGLANGTQMQFIEYGAAYLTVVTTAAASGGKDAEAQETYRERIRNWGIAAVTTGPSSRYEAVAKAVSDDILDVKAQNIGDGEVGVYLILKSGASSAGIIQSVTEALNDEGVRPLTDQVTVQAATAVAYTLSVKVWYSTASNIGDAVQAAIEEYQTWQDQKIGRAWNPDLLMALLYKAGCSRVQFLSGGIGTGETVEYTEIDTDECCSGTITLTEVTGS